MVCDLTAHLGIERGLVQHDKHALLDLAGFIGGNHGHDARRHLSGLLVGVDLDMRALDLGELAYLDVLTEQSSGFLDGFLHGGVTGGCCQNLIHGGCFGLDGVIEHAAGEFHELRGLGHEVGLGVQLDRIAGLAVGGFDNGGGDGAFLSLAAFTLASGLDALGADDFLGASPRHPQPRSEPS